jgi:hypothetical protein
LNHDSSHPGGWQSVEDSPMAQKTNMIPMASGGGLGRRVLGVLIALAILGMVIHDPAGSAETVVGIVQWVGNVIDALSTFGRALSERA